jgi:hypothetical protein
MNFIKDRRLLRSRYPERWRELLDYLRVSSGKPPRSADGGVSALAVCEPIWEDDVFHEAVRTQRLRCLTERPEKTSADELAIILNRCFNRKEPWWSKSYVEAAVVLYQYHADYDSERLGHALYRLLRERIAPAYMKINRRGVDEDLASQYVARVLQYLTRYREPKQRRRRTKTLARYVTYHTTMLNNLEVERFRIEARQRAVGDRKRWSWSTTGELMLSKEQHGRLALQQLIRNARGVGTSMGTELASIVDGLLEYPVWQVVRYHREIDPGKIAERLNWKVERVEQMLDAAVSRVLAKHGHRKLSRRATRRVRELMLAQLAG